MFGPLPHSNVLTLLQPEQWLFLQKVQMAIALYEKYVFRVGTLLAILVATMLIYFLKEDGLVWSYSGLLVGTAYAISAFSEFKRFQPDIAVYQSPGIFHQMGINNNKIGSSEGLNER